MKKNKHQQLTELEERCREKAGELFKEKVGVDFIRENEKCLMYDWQEEKEYFIFDFGIFSVDFDSVNIDDGHGGIVYNELSFPEIICQVKVYKKDYKAEIIPYEIFVDVEEKLETSFGTTLVIQPYVNVKVGDEINDQNGNKYKVESVIMPTRPDNEKISLIVKEIDNV